MIGQWDYKDNDFRLDDLGNRLRIITLPDLKLAFTGPKLIAFSAKNYTKWVVRKNSARDGELGRRAEEHMRSLQGTRFTTDPDFEPEAAMLRKYEGERLIASKFFATLQEAIAHPRLLLDLTARQAKESLKDL